MWTNDGRGAFFDSGQRLGTNGINLGQSGSLGDLDGDGDLDAFVVNENEPDTVWLNQNCFNKDGDAFTDYEEYIADTDPDEFFAVNRINGTNIQVEISFASSSNRSYTLEYTDDLMTGLWQNVSGQIDVLGVDGLLMLVDTSNVSRRFYRLRVAFP